MNRRRLISAAAAGILLAVLLGLGGRWLLFARIEAAVAALPAPVEYRSAKLHLRPVGITLEDVTIRRSSGDAAAPASGIARNLTGAHATAVHVGVNPARLSALIRRGRSAETIRDAIETVTATDFGGTATIRGAEVMFAGVEAAAVRETPEGVTLELRGLDLRLPGATARPADTAPGPGPTTADVIERLLGQAVAMRDALPPLRLTLRSGRVTREGSAVDVEGAVRSAPGESITLEARFEGGTERADAAAAKPVAGAFSGNLTVRNSAATTAEVDGTVATSNLTIQNETIALDPIVLPPLRYDFRAEVDTRAPFEPADMARRVPGTDVPPPLGAGAPEDADLRGTIRVTKGRLRVGGVNAEFRPVLQGLNAAPSGLPLPVAPARLDFAFQMPETPLQDIVEAIPVSIQGPLSGLQLGGTLSWEINAEAPVRRLSWTWWKETNQVTGFELRAVDPAYDVRALAGTFRHRIVNEDSGYRRVIAVPPRRGPADGRLSEGAWTSIPALGPTPADARPDPAYRYAEYSAISPVLVGAVITAEDGEYFRHKGVNWLAITAAMEANLAREGIVLGGSTIPMQLAKNVFLDDRRVLSRKLQELGLVALANLTETVERERILEIYLNVIEFGPRVYGIVDAAAHYFDATPAELTVPQAVWLASIIRDPASLSQHAAWGEVPQWWLERMAGMMEIMVERDRLSPEELSDARGVQPEFRAD
ncbi:MAG: hypothetical protein GVY29_05325 [Spirochaetes bacterium]|jgi:hypothetical protein|nr:hypothetical protein [Spirochaetota bacterium]